MEMRIRKMSSCSQKFQEPFANKLEKYNSKNSA